LNLLMKQKPGIIQHFLKAGLDVWYLDADTVALKDFRVLPDESSDIFASIDELEIFKESTWTTRLPAIGSGIMYFRSTPATIKALDLIIQHVNEVYTIDDNEAINEVIQKTSQIHAIERINGPAIQEGAAKLTFFKQKKIINGHLYFSYRERISHIEQDFHLIHANGQDPAPTLKREKLWFLEEDLSCKV